VTTADLHTLTGAYAVDALVPEEARQFEGHLAECAACAEEVRELRETAAVLGLAVAEAPPASLKTRVLAAIDTVRQLPPQAPAGEGDRSGAGDAPGSAGGAPGAADEPAGVRPLRPGHRRATSRQRWGRPLLAAAASIVILALGAGAVSTVVLQRRLDQVEAGAQAVTAVLTAPDARTVTAPVAGGGTGAVVVSAQRRAAVFVGAGLPELERDRTYQLWFIRGSDAASAGIFRPDREGRATTTLAGDPRTAELVGLTVEPAGGSRRPSRPPVLALPVAA
jgi:anti-sigma-K factor RskA